MDALRCIELSKLARGTRRGVGASFLTVKFTGLLKSSGACPRAERGGAGPRADSGGAGTLDTGDGLLDVRLSLGVGCNGLWAFVLGGEGTEMLGEEEGRAMERGVG